MSREIAQRELRNDNARIVDAVVGGESFVITRNGAPVAELTPFVTRRRRFVKRSDLFALRRAGVRIDAERFRADLDAAIDQAVP